MAPKSDTSPSQRHSPSLAFSGVRWWQGYDQTQGLDAFRADERYAVWLHTHRSLLASNFRYAEDTHWFWTCAALIVLMVMALWAFVGLLSTSATFGLAAATLLCCREQRRRNASIAQHLKTPA